MGREDYSWMVRFFGGGLFSSVVFSLCLPWLCGFFPKEEDEKE
jgi:hypothetical protein